MHAEATKKGAGNKRSGKEKQRDTNERTCSVAKCS